MDLNEEAGVVTIDVRDKIWSTLEIVAATNIGFIIGVGVMIIWP